jgi:hypothetical protein
MLTFGDALERRFEEQVDAPGCGGAGTARLPLTFTN